MNDDRQAAVPAHERLDRDKVHLHIVDAEHRVYLARGVRVALKGRCLVNNEVVSEAEMMFGVVEP